MNNTVLIAISQGNTEPWTTIWREGQAKTWIQDKEVYGILLQNFASWSVHASTHHLQQNQIPKSDGMQTSSYYDFIKIHDCLKSMSYGNDGAICASAATKITHNEL